MTQFLLFAVIRIEIPPRLGLLLLPLSMVIGCGERTRDSQIELPLPGAGQGILSSTGMIETNEQGRASQLVATISLKQRHSAITKNGARIPCHFELSIFSQDGLRRSVVVQDLRFARFDERANRDEYRSSEFFDVPVGTSKITVKNSGCEGGYVVPQGHISILNEVYE